MMRLVSFLILNLLALGALRGLGGWLRSRRFLVVFSVCGMLAIGAWAVPMLKGHGIHGSMPGILPFRVFATFWLVGMLAVLSLAVPILALRRLAEWRARRIGITVSKASPPPKLSGATATSVSNGSNVSTGSSASDVSNVPNVSDAPTGSSVSDVSDAMTFTDPSASESPTTGETVSFGGGGTSLSRRDLLARVGAAVPFVAGAGSLAGVTTGVAGFRVRRFDVQVRDLPPEFHGFRIGHITDVHVGPFITVDELARAVDAMNEEGVDLQVMTGDLIDDLSQLDGTMAALDRCRAPGGMMAVLGNHEHWRGLDRVKRAYANSRATLLVDESTLIQHRGASLRIVGVDFPMRSFGPQAQVMRKSAEHAFAGVESGELVLCLTHHPDFFPFAAERGARLTLAGHTHGGQVAPFGMPVFRFAYAHMLGWYKRGDSHLYVSPGTGHWLPFRIGVPPEVTIVTLQGEPVA